MTEFYQGDTVWASESRPEEVLAGSACLFWGPEPPYKGPASLLSGHVEKKRGLATLLLPRLAL
jgi:hypothetical protein